MVVCYGFRTEHAVLDTQIGRLSLLEANSPIYRRILVFIDQHELDPDVTKAVLDMKYY